MTTDIIFTTYFTGKQDPQITAKRRRNVIKHIKTKIRSVRGGARSEAPGVAGPDEFDRIQIWYESLQNVGCSAVIFHDELSQGFVDQWERPDVHFESYTLKTPRSLNDERYYCYLDYLKAHPEIERVFMLDLFDIEFFKNPFDLFDDDKFDIYCAGDEGEFNNKRNMEKMLIAYDSPLYEGNIKLNAGICGGNRTPIIKLLECMLTDFERLNLAENFVNLNMAVFNKCVYDIFEQKRILYGYPLNSRFKKYEKNGNFALRHK